VQVARAETARSKYPLDYPMRLTTSGANICRYHNYGECTRHRFGACDCDHEHCHACGCKGHTALQCSGGGSSGEAVQAGETAIARVDAPVMADLAV
jgi:hypothetical protein